MSYQTIRFDVFLLSIWELQFLYWFLLKHGKRQYGNQGHLYLFLNEIGWGATKLLMWKFCLRFRKKIYVPLFHVQIDNVFCGKFHVTDQEFHNEALLGIIHCNSSYMFWILFVCFISCQADNLINEYIRMSIVGQFALFYVLIE